ncbi:MbeD/MobD family mobilization/exclusion protein, partial [Escherichia coli]
MTELERHLLNALEQL